MRTAMLALKGKDGRWSVGCRAQRTEDACMDLYDGIANGDLDASRTVVVRIPRRMEATRRLGGEPRLDRICPRCHVGMRFHQEAPYFGRSCVETEMRA